MNSYFLLTQLESLLTSPRFGKQLMTKANDHCRKQMVWVNVTVVLGRHFNIYCQNLPTDNIMCFVQNSGLILCWLVDIATHAPLSYCVIQRCKLTSPINHDLTKCKRFASAILCDLQNWPEGITRTGEWTCLSSAHTIVPGTALSMSSFIWTNGDVEHFQFVTWWKNISIWLSNCDDYNLQWVCL